MTATPYSARTRLTSAAKRPMPEISPMSPPTTFTEARVVGWRRQASELAATITLLSVRPVVAMPNSPSSNAAQRVDPGCSNAVRIWAASPPVNPASSLTSSGSTQPARNPARPMKTKSIGTKNRNSRKAIALPTTVPATSRSRWYVRRPTSISGRFSYFARSAEKRVCSAFTRWRAPVTSALILPPAADSSGSGVDDGDVSPRRTRRGAWPPRRPRDSSGSVRRAGPRRRRGPCR